MIKFAYIFACLFFTLNLFGDIYTNKLTAWSFISILMIVYCAFFAWVETE